MTDSPLSPQEIRAAAEAHRELGPEYNDAVVASFLEKVDLEIAARVDARLAATSRAEPAAWNRWRTLLAGVGIGAALTGVPLGLIVLRDHAASSIRTAHAASGQPGRLVYQGPAVNTAWLLALLVVVAICATVAVRVTRKPASRQAIAGQ